MRKLNMAGLRITGLDMVGLRVAGLGVTGPLGVAGLDMVQAWLC